MPWLLDPIAGAAWAPSPCEAAAVVAGLVCVTAYVRGWVLAWPAGLIQVALYIPVFLQAKMYAEASLQAVWIAVQAWGWWHWLHGGPGRGAVPMASAGRRDWAIAGLATLAMWGVLGAVQAQWTDSDVPWWDAGVTALSLTAQWMIGRKLVENWLLWIAVDLAAIPLYWHKSLWFTAGLYVVFLVLACLGYLAWLRTCRARAAV